MRVEAPIKVDRKTKKLAKRLSAGEIAVINHIDIDEVAANSLVERKIKLVINAAPSISGRYPNKGPKILIDNNILIIDNVGENVFEELKEGQVIEVNNGQIYRDGQFIGSGEVMDKSVVEKRTQIAYENMSVELDRFIDNTIEYAKREKGFILGETEIPKMTTNYKDRHVLVVVRGQDYKEDLATIRGGISTFFATASSLGVLVFVALANLIGLSLTFYIIAFICFIALIGPTFINLFKKKY